MLEAATLLAFLAALIYAIGGALKGVKEGETFNPAQFVKTVILAIVVNAAVYFLGVPITEAEAFASSTVVVILLDKLLNTVFPTPATTAKTK
jgi:small basic protein